VDTHFFQPSTGEGYDLEPMREKKLGIGGRKICQGGNNKGRPWKGTTREPTPCSHLTVRNGKPGEMHRRKYAKGDWGKMSNQDTPVCN